MPSLSQIRQHNSTLPSRPLTAVFAGSTSGIGLGTVRALLRSVPGSTVYIIGRSASKFAPTLAELRKMDPTARITFLEAQVSLLKEVERVCGVIEKDLEGKGEGKIDVLFLAQGGLNAGEHEVTGEGLFVDYAVMFYGRMLFVERLLPLLRTGRGRVVSVLTAGQEGKVDEGDFGVQREETREALGFWGMLRQAVCLTSLVLGELAEREREVGFVHADPGFVATDVHSKWAGTMNGGVMGLGGWLLKAVVVPLTHAMARTPDVAGEVGLFECTTEAFGGANGKAHRVGSNGDDMGEKGAEVLREHERDGMGGRAWKHVQDTFEHVLSQ